ncbi:hypothetical protein [Streptomyces sp. Je 1-369]|uniref:hypothetical protein n=1 Tax=Streptomyces sp. Je 1-369 TaxID=2966192 RepID=UPI00228687A2|nr:hypothetical protein [Streptomyces sp. Je 1-369]WAL98764.1 hypothetical protein NOO62_32375 [Streptomyces sp. Je 1-369]
MKINLLLHAIHHDENDLAHTLLHVAERHKADHEIYHLGRDLARWSQDHVRTLATLGERFGAHLDPEPVGNLEMAARARHTTAGLTGRRPEAALLLLHDLREIYTKASGASVDWELLGQAVQGLRGTGLLNAVQLCHPDTRRQLHWANGKLKESAAQILVS